MGDHVRLSIDGRKAAITATCRVANPEHAKAIFIEEEVAHRFCQRNPQHNVACVPIQLFQIVAVCNPKPAAPVFGRCLDIIAAQA
jgi:hypothetical protein